MLPLKAYSLPRTLLRAIYLQNSTHGLKAMMCVSDSTSLSVTTGDALELDLLITVTVPAVE